jgi:hypothetical protein
MIGSVKKGFLFLLVAGISLNLFAQEGSSSEVKRFSFGAGLNISQSGVGSVLEFGFLIFHNERMDIRNHISLGATSIGASYIGEPYTYGDDGMKYNMLNLYERISVGSITRNGLFRPYGFIEGGVGFYETETKEILEMPLTFNYGLGYGLDIFVREETSFVIEAAVNRYKTEEHWLFLSKMTVAARVYM